MSITGEISGLLEKCRDNSILHKQDEVMLRPYKYIQQGQRKSLPLKLISAFNHWLNIPFDKLNLIGDIIQKLHTSSVLIEDIEDNATVQSGFAAAHSVFGTANTFNSANYAICLALNEVQMLDHPKAMKICLEHLPNMHRSHGMDIFWRNSFVCPTESDYKLLTIQKTGGFFLLAIRLMQLFSSTKYDFTKLIAIIAVYCQIRDDYLNLALKQFVTSKEFCEDLTKGKFTYPIIHAIHCRKDPRILDIVKTRTSDVEMKKSCVNLLEELGSFKYTRRVLRRLDIQAREEVARYGGNPVMENLLNELLSWKSVKVSKRSSSKSRRTIFCS